MPPELDESFTDLPLSSLADTALARARARGATQASFRLDRVRTARSSTYNAALLGSQDRIDIGLAVAVTWRGARGFAATTAVTTAAAAFAAEQAVQVAEACAALGGPPVEPADEPVHPNETWISNARINPFAIAEADRVDQLAQWSARLLAAPEVDQVRANLVVTQENKFYADLAGTVTVQQRIRVHPLLLASGTDGRTGVSASLRTLGPPTARGWEYLSGDGWDWDGELAELPELLGEKLRATPVDPGYHDLVIDPSNLWLTIHESVGHTTELDRALGHEMSYAGGTFATPDALGRLRFGSPLMNVTADRTAEHGLATTGFDDEGVAAQSWPLIEAGTLTGLQSDRRTARLIGADRSTGCAFAESAAHVPLQRMPNVSLLPAPTGPNVEELISEVGEGIYLVGSDSFSIDTRRDNFQFSAQRAHRIRKGRLAGQLSAVAYEARTTEFWAALQAVGGERSYRMFGADLCGKGQPVQIAATSHGCPCALFRDIRVLNTDAAATR